MKALPLSQRLTLSYADVAALTGLSARTVRRLVADGSLPCVRIGSRTLVTRRALDAWIAADMPRALVPRKPEPRGGWHPSGDAA